MIKAIFFDIDGTLLSIKTGQVPASAKKAIIKLREKGIRTFIATGRNMLQIESLPMEGIPFDGYVTLNGQICLDGKERVLYESPIHTDDLAYMVSVFEKKEIPVIIVEKDCMYINYVDDFVRRVKEEVHAPESQIGVYQGEKVYQFIVYADEKQADQLLEQMPHCKFTRWNAFGIDMISKESGKTNGISHLLKHYGISQDEVMAFGDGDNDKEMLAFAQIGIAMGNAQEEVKKRADYVTDEVEEDGIWNALRHYHIL